MLYVFRNTTAELLFGTEGVTYSGYGDITIPQTAADTFVWFYLTPIHADSAETVREIESYTNRLELVATQIPPEKRFLVFTLENLYPLKMETGDFSVELALRDFQQRLSALAARHANLRIIDFAAFLRKFPDRDLVDWKYYFLSETELNPKLAAPFRNWFSHVLHTLDTRERKCLVLDLDNTLWGGILGEDGASGIRIGGDYPGNAFLLFQQQIRALSERGVILAVCSKNNDADVLEAWKSNPYLALRQEHFAAIRINWDNKADNLRELAEELNLGLDSFVFLDDQPAERELVRSLLPEVTVPEFPDKPYLLPTFFKELVEEHFSLYRTTAEDRSKTNQYHENAQRTAARAAFANFDDYLKSLDIRTDIREADSFSLPRVAQMAQKTNQFNLTTCRYTETDLKSLLNQGASIYTLSVQDKFGDSGMTGALIITFPAKDSARIDSLFLSCRILGRNIEHTFLAEILNRLTESGIRTVTAEYIPTSKNTQVRDFYDREGFSLTGETDGQREYRREVGSSNP